MFTFVPRPDSYERRTSQDTHHIENLHVCCASSRSWLSTSASHLKPTSLNITSIPGYIDWASMPPDIVWGCFKLQTFVIYIKMERHGLLIFLCQQKQETSRKIDLLIETTRNIFFLVCYNKWQTLDGFTPSNGFKSWRWLGGPGGIPGGEVGGVGVTWCLIMFLGRTKQQHGGLNSWIEPMRIRINQHYWWSVVIWKIIHQHGQYMAI